MYAVTRFDIVPPDVFFPKLIFSTTTVPMTSIAVLLEDLVEILQQTYCFRQCKLLCLSRKSGLEKYITGCNIKGYYGKYRDLPVRTA